MILKAIVRASLLLPLLASAALLQDQDLRSRAHAIAKKVSVLRGLEFKKEVKIGIYSRDELRKFLIEDFKREIPEKEFEAMEKILKKFGAVPKNLDVRKALEDLMTASILGFYHLRTKELRLVKGGKDPVRERMNRQMKQLFGVTMDEITLAHELCHAAQDQRFDLMKYWPLEAKDNDDLVIALKVVIEGDANLLGWVYATGDRIDQVLPLILSSYKSGATGPGTEDIPVFLRKSLAFPYGYGTEFVQGIWKKKGKDWEAVTNLFEDPPLSTEQVLHPEKYAERDFPQIIGHSGLKEAFEGWPCLHDGVMGELQIRLLFEQLGVDGGEEAAAGWDGDRYWGFQGPGDRVMIVWFTTWDSEEDAREFREAWFDVIDAKYEDAKREGETVATSAKEYALVRRKGKDVLVVEGAPLTVLEKVGGLWEGFTRRELTKVPKYTPRKQAGD